MIKRTPSGESYKGIPVVAYHWTEASGLPKASSQTLDRVAFHWSTGPKDAEPLVRLSDVMNFLLEKTPEVSNEDYSEVCPKALAQRQLDEDDMGGGAYG